MQARPSVPVFVLNVHRDYACGHSGICCASGWDIPVDPGTCAGLREALGAGVLAIPGPMGPRTARDSPPLIEGPGLPEGIAAILARSPDGGCVFLDRAGGNRCAIHAALGHEAKPSSCRHFPCVARLDDQETRVSLSHYCPGAARLLFQPGLPRVEVVPAPPVAVTAAAEGFDARGTVPPFLRPGVAFDEASRRLWDQFVLDTCNREGWTADDVLARLRTAAVRLAAWTPASGPLADDVRNQSRIDFAAGASSDCINQSGIDYRVVEATVPDGLPRPGLPDDLEAADARWVAPAWRAFSIPLRRYLAARAFGAWAAYQADGVVTEVAVLRAALAVVRVEAVREAVAANAPLDASLLQRAIQAADLLTVHRSDCGDVVRQLSTW